MIQYIDALNYKSILVLDGAIPQKSFFNKINLPVIATDGATNKLHRLGVPVDLVIGDLDSVDSALLKCYRYEEIVDQSRSDFQKALRYMVKNYLLPAIICGIAGGYVDHEINNINIFMQTTDDNIFVTDDVIGYKLRDTGIYEFPIGTKISIIGMPECKLTTRGLKWELKNYHSKFPGQNSCFNRVISVPFTVTEISGTALMLVYTKEISDAGLLI